MLPLRARLVISASTTETPSPGACTITGLRSIAKISSAWSCGELREPHHQQSKARQYRPPGYRESGRICRPPLRRPSRARACRTIERHRRQRHIAERFDQHAAQARPSAAGPRSASRLTPRMTSRPGGAIGCTSTPSICATAARKFFAAASTAFISGAHVIRSPRDVERHGAGFGFVRECPRTAL